MKSRDQAHYDALEVTYDQLDPREPETTAIIRQKYLEFMAIWHPELNADVDDYQVEGVNFAEEEAAKIQQAYDVLTDPRERFKYDFPSGRYFDIEIPDFLDNHKQKRKLEEEQRRKAQLKLAMAVASKREKVGAFLNGFFYGLGLFVAGLAFTGLVLAAYVPFLLALWFKPELIPQKITEIFDDPLMSFKAKLGVTLVSAIALPVVAIGIPLISIYTSQHNARHAYREMTARGLSRNQKIALVVGAVIVTAALLVVFPPAGLASVFGSAGVIASVASSIGVGSLGVSGVAAGFAFAAGAAVGAVGYLGGKVCDFFRWAKRSCCPSKPVIPPARDIFPSGSPARKAPPSPVVERAVPPQTVAVVGKPVEYVATHSPLVARGLHQPRRRRLVKPELQQPLLQKVVSLS